MTPPSSTKNCPNPLFDYECIQSTLETPPKQLNPPNRLLCGSGPADAHPRVYSAMTLPQIGFQDPAFFVMMDDIRNLLRYAWQTSNRFTIALAATGYGAMEACIANLVQPGERVLVGCNGHFGLRFSEMADRYRADVVRMGAPWGSVFSLEEIKTAIEKYHPAVVALIHADSSTGTAQPLEGVGELCHMHGALLIVDSVSSFCGVPFHLDKWGVDAAFAGPQKCLGSPSGVTPLTFSERAIEKLEAREDKVPIWYLDMTMVAKFVLYGEGMPRHNAPVSLLFGLREALTMVYDEGLEARWKRHRAVAEAFWAGLEDIGLECLVAKEHRLPSLTIVKVPRCVDGDAVTDYLLDKYQIEISNGIGLLAGKVWRIGLMGYNSRFDVAVTLLSALREALMAQDYRAQVIATE